jgi:ElaB/YqjD/DUF883 family membrane-anchored ribosome-binding protein
MAHVERCYYRHKEDLEMEATKEKLASDFGNAKELLKETATQAGEKSPAAPQKMTQGLEEGKKMLPEAQKVFVDQSTKAAKTTEAYARKNPWSTLGIVAGIGLVFALFSPRR